MGEKQTVDQRVLWICFLVSDNDVQQDKELLATFDSEYKQWN